MGKNKIKIGINGFGRMGRLFLRKAFQYSNLEIVHINEIAGDINTSAHLLNFDSVHGIWDKEAFVEKNNIRVGKKLISFSQCKDIQSDIWKDSDADIIVECSGKFKDQDYLMKYIDLGIKKVLVSAPVKDVPNIVYGVNEDIYNNETDNIISAASCTTNCLAPIVDVIHKKFSIKHGVITTIHNITNTQSILDQPKKDLRRSRAGGTSLIPTTTGSAKAITVIFPELKGKLNGIAVRVPLANSSITDCVFEVSKTTSVEEINQSLKTASENNMNGILGFEERPLVSIDFKGDERSSIIDSLSTNVIDGTMVKILSWYDNEIGYVCRMRDLVQMLAKSI